MTTNKKTTKNKRVLVGFSGGVDSTITSYLLKQKGFFVTGVFLDCNGDKEKEKLAEKMAKKIGISFLVIDAKKEFKKRVIDYFVKELERGRTPNPCVVCNQKIKFDILVSKLKETKEGYIATGHYARILKKNNNENIILKAKDTEKDQSYFLWRIKKELLNYVLFPLGNLTKKEVKKIAKEKKIITKNYKESQEVCFIDDMNNFLSNHIKDKDGGIVDIKGNLLGRHQGIHYYTIGQRKGMNLPHGPYYVAKKDVKNNLLIVADNKKDLLQKELFYEDSNFFIKKEFPFKAEAKIRYNGTLEKVIVEKKKVVFINPVMAITPGQSIVFYNKEKIIGGGIIK